MLRTTAIRKKEIRDAEPGELIRMRLGTAASLALVLKIHDDRRALFGIISSPSFSRPMTWYNGERADSCLSYGTDWVIDELHGSETAPGMMYHHEGAWLLLDERLIFRFTEPGASQGFRSVFFDLESSEPVDHVGQEASPILKWKIWESEDHRSSDSEPLFTSWEL